MILRVKTVSIYVGDQEAALRFWTTTMGFELRRRQAMGPTSLHPHGTGADWIEVAPPGSQTHLVLHSRSMVPNYGELRPSLVFACKDVVAEANRLKAAGVLVPWGPERLPMGTFARFCDPDGNEFLLTDAP